jgi:Tol biopolymer transport system component
MDPWHPNILGSPLMKPLTYLVACLASLLLLSNPGHARPGGKGDPDPPVAQKGAAPKPDDEPDLVVTPNPIRIQSTARPEEGRWVVMPGFSELGSPCFSGDGEWIAFDAYKGGYNNSPSECWIARKDGRDLRRLAMGATPRWSPDGERLLFMRNEANDPKREPGIFLIDRDGKGERRIGDGRWPDWSPDGQRIAFSLGGRPGPGLREGATICIAKADGTGRRQIAEGDSPSWSPDGKKIAYCRRAAGRPPLLYVHDLGTGKDEMLGTGWFRANWMPDGKSVVANGVVGRKAGMVRLSLDAPGRPEELATGFEEPFSPCCSRDGKQIIFIARRPKR